MNKIKEMLGGSHEKSNTSSTGTTHDTTTGTGNTSSTTGSGMGSSTTGHNSSLSGNNSAAFDKDASAAKIYDERTANSWDESGKQSTGHHSTSNTNAGNFAANDPISSGNTGSSTTEYNDRTGHTHPTTGQHTNDSTFRNDPTSASQGGAAGLATSELTDRSNTGSSHHAHDLAAMGAAQHTSGGPHTTFTANRLDPNAKEEIPYFHEEHTHGRGIEHGNQSTSTQQYAQEHFDTNRGPEFTGGVAGTSSGLGSSASGYGNQSSGLGSSTTGTGFGSSSTTGQHDSHLGRDAAVGAGGLGAGGLAAHEYEQHHNKPSATDRYDQGTGSSGLGSSGLGSSTSGYGSHGVDTSDDYPKKIVPGASGGSNPPTSGHEVENAPHGIKAHMKAGHLTSRADEVRDPYAADGSSTQRGSHPTSEVNSSGFGSHDSHAGRDAALGAGAVGAGGLAAHEYDSNRAGYTGIGQPSTTSHGMTSHEIKEHEKHQHQREKDGSQLSSHMDGKHEHGHADKDEKKGSGILGGLLGGHKDKKEHNLEDQYAGRTDQRSAEVHPDSTSHADRNTALGAGALGAGGLAAHEYDNRSSPAGGSYPNTSSSTQQNFSRPTGSSTDPYSTSSTGPTGSAVSSQYGQQGGSFATENPLSDHHASTAGVGGAATGTALGAESMSRDAYAGGQQGSGLGSSSTTTDPYSTSSQSQSTGTHAFGSKLPQREPHHYGENAHNQQPIAEGGNSAKRHGAYGHSSSKSATPLIVKDTSSSEAYDPRNPNYGSSSAVGQTDGYGQRSDPTTGIEGTSAGTGNNQYTSNTSGLDRSASGKERSGVSKLLHREHPNKLHKEPPQGYGN